MTEKQYLLDHLHIFNPNKINSFDDTESLYNVVKQLSEQQCMSINEALKKINLGISASHPKWGITKIHFQPEKSLSATFTLFGESVAGDSSLEQIQSEEEIIKTALDNP
jgi:hypothetical protein